MRRFISCCIIAIILINTPVNARAAVPLPAVAGGVLAISLATGAYIYYRSGSSSTVSPAFVSRAADAAWYSRGAATVGLMLATRPITMRLPTNNIMSAANAAPSTYPKLSAAAAPKPDALAVGQVISTAYGNMICTVIQSWSYADPALIYKTDAAANNMSASGGYVTTYTLAADQSRANSTSFYASAARRVYFSPSTAAVTYTPPAVTPATFASTIAPTGVVTDSALQAELDKMFSDPTYVPEFTDGTTGLPWAPPADVVRPEKWTEIDERTKAITAAQSAVNAARTAVNELQNRHNAAVAAANADPTNPEKQRELSDLAIALGTAQARQAELEQQLATKIADAAADTDDPDPPVDPGDVPTLKTINWSYGTKLLGSLETAWPFNLLLSLRGMLSPLEASPVAPSFDLPIWGDNNISLSLSVFDPVALVLRWSLSLLLTVGAVMAVVRWYRGGS